MKKNVDFTKLCALYEQVGGIAPPISTPTTGETDKDNDKDVVDKTQAAQQEIGNITQILKPLINDNTLRDNVINGLINMEPSDVSLLFSNIMAAKQKSSQEEIEKTKEAVPGNIP